jgi:hypothetical protein
VNRIGEVRNRVGGRISQAEFVQEIGKHRVVNQRIVPGSGRLENERALRLRIGTFFDDTRTGVVQRTLTTVALKPIGLWMRRISSRLAYA